MNIDFSTALRELNGDVMKSEMTKEPFLLRDAATLALNASFPDEQGIDGTERAKRGYLAMKIYGETLNQKTVDMTVEEVSLLKKLIGKAFAPLVIARCYILLEGA